MKISKKRFDRAAGRFGKRAGKKLGGLLSAYAVKKFNKFAGTPVGGFLSEFF
jgi:hypothetical protein